MKKYQPSQHAKFLSAGFFEELLLITDSLQRKQACAREDVSSEDWLSSAVKQIKSCEVISQNNRYLIYDQIERGITFVKSPKGSGKTTAVSQAIDNYQKLKSKKNKSKNVGEVLLIGHRKALITANCHKLGLNSYLDLSENSNSGDFLDKFGVCLDSLGKLGDKKYDLIVIDEVEQVLAHFLSKTMERNSIKLFKQFQKLISYAERVVLLDADIGWLSFSVFNTINSKSSKRKKLRFILNTNQFANKEINLHTSKDHLVGLMVKKIKENKKVFFCSNSKSQVDRLAFALDSENSESGKKILKVTSDNSTSPKIQKIIKDISDEISEFDLVLTSPSMGTGIDISFPNDHQKIDCVFGIFNNHITTHTEIDQQLHRVRNPKEVHVWISPSTHNYTTDFISSRAECLYHHLESVMLPTDQLLAGVDFIQTVEDFVALGTLVTAQRRASFNTLKANFIDMKIAQGYQVTVLDSDENQMKIGKNLEKIGGELSAAEYISRIRISPELHQDEFDRYVERLAQNNSDVPESIRYAVKKYWIKKFFPGATLTDELILSARTDQLRKSVLRFEKLTDENFYQKNSGHINRALEIAGRESVAFRELRDADVLLINYLLSQTPVYDCCNFKDGIEFCAEDLSGFAKKSLKLKKEIEGQLQVEVRDDIEGKPTSQLKTFLRLVGLDFSHSRTSSVGGVKRRYYVINQAAVKQMKYYVECRKLARCGMPHPESEVD